MTKQNSNQLEPELQATFEEREQKTLLTHAIYTDNYNRMPDLGFLLPTGLL